jgi:hypothetical protein
MENVIDFFLQLYKDLEVGGRDLFKKFAARYLPNESLES